MPVEPIELTDGDYETRLASASGLLFFYKKLCPNCKAIKTVIGKFTATRSDVVVMQVDSEENPAAMAAMDVEKVPALLIMRNGAVAARKVGLMNVKELTQLYDSP